MSAVERLEPPDLLIAVSVTLIVQFGFVGLISSPDRKMHIAAISDERAQPIAISVTPLPLLKKGSSSPLALPAAWQRRAPGSATRTPMKDPASPNAPTPTSGGDRAISTHADAGPNSPSMFDASPLLPFAAEGGGAVAAGGSEDAGLPEGLSRGSPNGSPDGTETDPLKGRAVDLYRAQLSAFFLRGFAIRGKLPFETLKTLRASATVRVSADRRVEDFTIAAPSNNDVFDREVRAALEQRRGVELPPPPALYPDVLGKSFPVLFQCTSRSQCE